MVLRKNEREATSKQDCINYASCRKFEEGQDAYFVGFKRKKATSSFESNGRITSLLNIDFEWNLFFFFCKIRVLK